MDRCGYPETKARHSDAEIRYNDNGQGSLAKRFPAQDQIIEEAMRRGGSKSRAEEDASVYVSVSATTWHIFVIEIVLENNDN